MTFPAVARGARGARRALAVSAVCAVLVPLTACGGGDGETASGGRSPAAGVPVAPTESRAPAEGKGSKDPDDINGDGHRDLLVPVTVGGKAGDQNRHERVAVVYGSAEGLDPATRTVHGRRALGLPQPTPPDRPEGPSDAGPSGPEPSAPARSDDVAAEDVLTADLDGDGYADFITDVEGEQATDGHVSAAHAAPYVSWGGPGGPPAGSEDGPDATPVRLPGNVSKLGVEDVVRGDFDGDGHHDLAAPARNEPSLVLLYGPFTRSGAPARTDTGVPWDEGDLVADAIDPSGKPRATSLLLHDVSDGEQTGNTLYPARRGTGLSPEGRKLRVGNAHAFGDFDGDGTRDVAVGDDGSRNNEPGYETEAPEVGGSFAVYPGGGAEPVTRELPETPEDATTYYGPGGYAAADPDGDGRDGLLVATYEGATLIDTPLDGDERTQVLRRGPAKAGGEKTPAKWRHARPAGAGDFDGDGTDELLLNWGPGTLFGLYGKHPTHWWLTDGTTRGDKASFETTKFAPRAS
ncbi:hypothetical protein DVA86_25965 [Streptomyces armeniacus]|uniref:VCBS repeat-containing protein n=1 Tax=Streptomyces armeniacus TaxID=83291 RepID=A0A345XVA8_9ACTN|nr:hypothetical protein [Streptomyces armeniacus]AXK35574.1 hypothetical protein DVA86_25965 [Streptomyces armeniacus]